MKRKLEQQYVPSQTSRAVKLWKEELAKVSEKSAQALADPEDYENLFPGLQESIKTEEFLRQQCQVGKKRAAEFPSVVPHQDRHPVEEMKAAEVAGTFVPTAVDTSSTRSAPCPAQEPVGKAEVAEAPNDEYVDLDQLEQELEQDIENLALDDNVDYKLQEDLLSDD